MAAIVVTVAAAWAYLARSAAMSGSMGDMADMADMAGMDMGAAALERWSWTEWGLLFTMWAVMMAAMMLPSAAPMMLLFSRIGLSRSSRGGRHLPVLFFGLGYLTVWWGFSAVAALIQWQLHGAAVLSADMRAVSPVFGGLVLIAAGVYQWLPVKQTCLRHCRTPFGFLTTSWREGDWGALSMGLTHGVFCLGCCWLLMALLFVTGVMNLAWVAAISGIVLLEKVVPGGPVIARAAGIIFICVGLAFLV